MSKETKIQWCDSTVNFWSGCTKVSPGCAHCYAEVNIGVKLRGQKWGKGAPRMLHESAFKMAMSLNRKPWICDQDNKAYSNEAIKSLRHGSLLTFHRRRIFSLSLGDWLDDEVSIEWLMRMLDTIRRCDQVIWILCTKRPENFMSQFNEVCEYLSDHQTVPEFKSYNWIADWMHRESEPPSNIILLASVENQEQADKRIPELLKIPAVCRGLSLEPLLGPVDLTYITDKNRFPGCAHFDVLNGRMIHHDDDMNWSPDEKVDWLIIGGESGPKARLCNVEWIREIITNGKSAGVATFVKQLGADPIWQQTVKNQDGFDAIVSSCNLKLRDKKGGDWSEWPEDLRIRQFPNLELKNRCQRCGQETNMPFHTCRPDK